MGVKIRCTECGKTVPAAPSAKAKQKVCSQACRKKRNRKLARKRRRAELQEYRQDEVRRKRAQRQRDRERERRQRGLTAESESASWQAEADCHAPGSTYNLSEVLQKVDEIVDETFAVSRARLRQELEAMVWKTAAQSTMPPVRAGP